MSDSHEHEDKGLRAGGAVGAGAGGIVGGVVIGALFLSGPPGWLTGITGVAIVLGCAAVGAVAGAFSGK